MPVSSGQRAPSEWPDRSGDVALGWAVRRASPVQERGKGKKQKKTSVELLKQMRNFRQESQSSPQWDIVA